VLVAHRFLLVVPVHFCARPVLLPLEQDIPLVLPRVLLLLLVLLPLLLGGLLVLLRGALPVMLLGVPLVLLLGSHLVLLLLVLLMVAPLVLPLLHLCLVLPLGALLVSLCLALPMVALPLPPPHLILLLGVFLVLLGIPLALPLMVVVTLARVSARPPGCQRERRCPPLTCAAPAKQMASFCTELGLRIKRRETCPAKGVCAFCAWTLVASVSAGPSTPQRVREGGAWVRAGV
jgi:hypothetical protein